MKIRHKVDVSSKRASEYPDIGDQLDAIYKLAESLRQQGSSLPDDVLTWLDQCKAVKQKYPKGE